MHFNFDLLCTSTYNALQLWLQSSQDIDFSISQDIIAVVEVHFNESIILEFCEQQVLRSNEVSGNRNGYYRI